MSTYRRSDATEVPEVYDNCPDFLKCYLNYLATFENKKVATVLEAFVGLREFFQYIHYCNVIHEKPSTRDAHKDLDVSQMELSEICRVSEADIENYLCFLDTVTRNAISTLAKKLSYIRCFFAYLDRNAQELMIHLPNGNPVRRISNPKLTKNLPAQAFSVEQINRLVSSTTGIFAQRDSAIILLIATTALNISEVCALNKTDLNLKQSTLRIRGHEGAARTVYITPACNRYLEQYLNFRASQCEDNDFSKALFVGRSNKRMTPRAIQLRISRAAAVAGMAQLNITAQDLRDSAIVAMLDGSTPAQRQLILNSVGLRTNKAKNRFLTALPPADSDPDVMQAIVNDSSLTQLGQ